ncbi:MAG TPA: HD domain-containing protein [bacterium]|nr:HD domain-containing protein [bacterium]
MKNNFKQLKKEVLNILQNGRPDWDIPHTLTSVYYIKKLLKKEGGNAKILITTMYLHDIGYSWVRRDLNKRDNVIKSKLDHMKNGVIFGRQILDKLNYADDEKKQILHLIGIHDNLNDIFDTNKQLVFEADSLAQIDTKRAKSNLNNEDRIKFINGFEEKRLPKFKTKTGIKLVGKLFKRAKKFYLK